MFSVSDKHGEVLFIVESKDVGDPANNDRILISSFNSLLKYAVCSLLQPWYGSLFIHLFTDLYVFQLTHMWETHFEIIYLHLLISCYNNQIF